jgi:pimeloyl-ACP methyl ester carboxylesterase
VDPDRFDTEGFAIPRQEAAVAPQRAYGCLRSVPLNVTMEWERLIRVGGRHLRVRRSGTGPPILLLNGMGMSLATWSPFERYLDGFDRIKVGMPRNGGILARQPVLTMRNFAALAGDLLDQLAIERADVLGLSFGGMVAQQLAHDLPTRVRRLVLVSTSCGLGGMPSNPASWWNAMLADTWLTSSWWDPRWPARQWSHLMMREFGARWATGPRLRGFAEQIAAASLWSSVPWLPQLTQETLVITGTADPLVPAANASILASRMPHAHIYPVHGGGHLCLLDRAVEVGPVVAAFLRSLEVTAINEAAEFR